MTGSPYTLSESGCHDLLSTWKNTDIYAPDRPLPMTENGVFILESDDPHTQLGTRKGKYPQAREFDKDGKPVRDIDFTDHDKPHNHSNPHQHRYESDWGNKE